jgi:hypothetical protein
LQAGGILTPFIVVPLVLSSAGKGWVADGVVHCPVVVEYDAMGGV